MLAMENVRNLSKMLKSSMGGVGKHGSIAIVRQVMVNQTSIAFESFTAALDDIIKNQLWGKVRDPLGLPFESFASFALAPAPHGLGIASQSSARLVRQGLLDQKHYREWTELLKEIARKPGNPGTIVNHECSRFYTVGRASTSSDRLLLLLERKSPIHYNAVCNGERSPYGAAIDAGLIAPRTTEHIGFRVILQAARQMKNKAQGKLLRILFEQLSLDAQCTLIANSIEGGLEMPGLARQWRAVASQTTAGGSDRQH